MLGGVKNMRVHETEQDILLGKRVAETKELLGDVHSKKLYRVGMSLSDKSELPDGHPLRRIASQIESRYRKEGCDNPQDITDMAICIATYTDIDLDTLREAIKSRSRKNQIT